MQATYPIVTDEEFPHGVECYRCHRYIVAGQPYSEHPDEFIGEDISVWLACVYC